jgi:hypothetical protein
MNNALKALRIISSAILFALVIFALAAAPGFLTNSSSTVPVGSTMGTAR